MIDTVICGTVPDALGPIPDQYVQACITSPPYWGLRDYGLDLVVWDGGPECDHEWETDFACPTKIGKQGSTEYGKWPALANGMEKPKAGSFCVHCGAWLGCLGLEPTPELYIDHLVQIFREVKRVLRDDGTLWINIGDSYCAGTTSNRQKGTLDFAEGTLIARQMPRNGTPNGLKPKDMVLIPFRLALALQADGWWVRSDIIWHKPNVMPSSVKDRPTTDFEHVFLLSKNKKYYYDQDAIREPWKDESIAVESRGHNSKMYARVRLADHRDKRINGIAGGNVDFKKGRNKRTVWTINTRPYSEAHFATFPPELIEPMILAGSAEGDIVLDPFAGSGTTLAEAKQHGRHYVGIEAQKEYIPLIESRVEEVAILIRAEQAQLKLF